MARPHWPAALLIALHLFLAGVYSVWNPLGEAPDEADHWAYVVYLARERSLPEGPTVTQSKHPPFYHAGAAFLAELGEPQFDFLRANPDIAITSGPTQSPNFFIHTRLEARPWQAGPASMHLARLWSVLLSTATVAAVYGLARAAMPDRPGTALLATGLAATLPEFAFIGGAVNNDNAAALFATLGLWGALAIFRGDGRWQAGWWTSLALGLGLLSKVSTVTLWPIVALALVLGAARPLDADQRRRIDVWAGRSLATWPRWLVGGLITFLPALALAAPWLIRNWRLYGDPTGMALVRETIDLRTAPWTLSDTGWLLRGWFASFWGKFGGAGHLPYPSWVYWILGATVLFAVAGVAHLWLRETRYRIVLLLLIAAVVTVAFGIWRYSLVALGTDQGRLLFPVLGPLLLLLAVGWSAWPWGRAGVWLGTGAIAALAALALYGLTGVIHRAFAPPPAPDPATVETAAISPLIWDNELALVGIQLDEDVTLFWRAEQAPSHDWRTELRIIAPDGSLVWEKRRSPAYGRWSTDRWSAKTLMADRYVVGWPEWAGPGDYQVELSLAPFGVDSVSPINSTGELLPPTVVIGTLQRR